MIQTAIAFHSGFGHTKALADAVGRGIQSIGGAKAMLVPVEQAEALAAALDGADATVFGAPTYMGGASTTFKEFMDRSSKTWGNSAGRTSSPPGSPTRPRRTATGRTR